ncbi:xanthine phosphoribosyltransferase [Lactovum miscens]|uniref:Xanthine phosphoribosyltransferase n=1 Tax=Lactovum miscens TaxID=190387 RepID=A0A841C781_9LACT|nr:xanthine phosphoribosyltransferase [Lactovum miscens]MBB5888204.1 xanthine phosphoribosyltransferase [Lactovum miscens]
MKLLEDKIKRDGLILGDDILKVDSFITHQIDIELMKAIGQRLATVYTENKITKVVTIEASGIAPAIYAADFLHVPLVFAKKSKNVTLTDELLTTEVFSFTKKVTSTVSISHKYLSPEDNILIVDDFLANGQAASGLVDIIQQAQSNIAGVGIVIEKSFQDGRKLLQDKGLQVTALTRIGKFENRQINFLEADDAYLD